jgi:hypothetical protein
MKLLQQIQSGRRPAPRRVIVYGTHGIGKSTFGAMAPRPIFIQTEDDLSEIDCDRLPLTLAFSEAMQALAELYTADHDYRTVVVDSLDWLERLIHTEVCQQKHVQNIETSAIRRATRSPSRNGGSSSPDWMHFAMTAA